VRATIPSSRAFMHNDIPVIAFVQAMIQRHILLMSLSLTVAVLASCGSPIHLSIYRTQTEWVDLREWPSGYPTGAKHSHPVALEPETIREVLSKVNYQKSTLFAFVMGHTRPVFSDYQVTLLSSELSRAFEQVLPQEIISFQVRNEENGNRHTKGFCFFLEHEFHLIIQELDQPDFYSQASEPRPMTSHWKFSPKKGQRLFSSHLGQKAEYPHWLIIPVRTRENLA